MDFGPTGWSVQRRSTERYRRYTVKLVTIQPREFWTGTP
jgi:hypothetical protein